MTGWKHDRRTRPEYRKLYNTAAWQRLRKSILIRDGYQCQWPGCGSLLIGKGNAHDAPVVHHKVDHKGDMALFLAPDNLMSVCKECHDRAAQEQAHRGFIAGHDDDGRSLDPAHPWAR